MDFNRRLLADIRGMRGTLRSDPERLLTLQGAQSAVCGRRQGAPACVIERAFRMNGLAAPRQILLATDLGSRCDRALDRAVLCAREWRSELVALTVIEPGSGASPYRTASLANGCRDDLSPRTRAEQRLRADLAYEDFPLAARVELGSVVDTILAVAKADASELVVTGVARSEALSRILLGSTVDALARACPVPLLVVRSRPRAPYARVVVATDFSEPSRRALEVVVSFFPDADLTLFHAFGNAFPTPPGVDLLEARSTAREQAEGEAAAFLKHCALPTPVRERVRLMMACGDAGLLLHEHGTKHPADLLVLGTQQHRGLMGLLIGSVAERILELAENDVLIVPPAPAA
jgi:nucleotide-binding universal stress UspA family protein